MKKKFVCDELLCVDCGACVSICPVNCISRLDNGFNTSYCIDENICINCGLCSKVCQSKNNIEFNEYPLECYECYDKKNDNRKESASGGLSMIMAKKIIEIGGWFCSVSSQNNEFSFILTNSIDDLKFYRGSKYVKTNMNDIYISIYQKLLKYKVLFIGLPCQIQGLYNFLKLKSNGNFLVKNNLFSVDLICHGTPSRLILKKYLVEKNIYTTNNIKFRNKANYTISAGGRYLSGNKKVMDPYSIAFFNGLIFTENCYTCKFAKLNRISNITIGDSWGSKIETLKALGVSLAIINDKKGQMFFNELKECLIYKERDYEDATLYNSQLNNPSIKPRRYNKLKANFYSGKHFYSCVFLIKPYPFIKQNVKKILMFFSKGN